MSLVVNPTAAGSTGTSLVAVAAGKSTTSLFSGFSAQSSLLAVRRLCIIHSHISPWGSKTIKGLSPLATSGSATTDVTGSATMQSKKAPTRSYSSEEGPKMLGVDLRGRTALVTGSTQGIGLDLARAFFDNGANVVLNGFGDPQQIQAIVKDMQSRGTNRVIYLPADMSKPQEITRLIEESQKQMNSPIDILVNNAGIQHVSPVSEFSAEKWDQLIAVNLSAVFHAMKAVLPGMKERGYGRVINISSVHGLVASKNKAAYVAAKHGVVGLTKVAALEYAGSGVTCNCINPGWVLTDLVKRQIEAVAEKSNMSFEAASQHILQEKQPSMQFVTGRQLGLTALFLCSESASQLTGVSLPVDGGWTSQ